MKNCGIIHTANKKTYINDVNSQNGLQSPTNPPHSQKQSPINQNHNLESGSGWVGVPKKTTASFT
jgi:hypothetical protein